MKQIVSIACVALLVNAFAGCRKDNPKDANASNSITGSWELRKSSAAMNPNVHIFPPGNGNILKFTDAGYQLYINGQLVKTGVYAVVEDLTVESNVCLVLPAGEYTHRIVYDDNYTATKEFIQISGTKLSVISGCYAIDAGHTLEYERQSR